MSLQQELNIFKADEHSSAEIIEFERKLYHQVESLPWYKLTATLLGLGTPFIGFLYNVELKAYLTVDSDDKWIYATAASFPGALRFSVYSDSKNNTVVAAAIGQETKYLNWRNTTGAVKLYDSYDNMDFRKWNDTVFQIYSYQQKQFMGLKEKKGTEMYYHATVYDYKFEYHYINHTDLNEDQTLIWRNYLKTYPEYMPQFSGIPT